MHLFTDVGWMWDGACCNWEGKALFALVKIFSTQCCQYDIKA